MSISHQRILKELTKKPMTLNEIHKATNYSKSGIRGRISELRGQGYNIQFLGGKEKKYIIHKKEDSYKDKILDLLDKTNRYDTILEIDKLSRHLNLSIDKVEEVLLEIYKEGKLIQISNNKVVIKK